MPAAARADGGKVEGKPTLSVRGFKTRDSQVVGRGMHSVRIPHKETGADLKGEGTTGFLPLPWPLDSHLKGRQKAAPCPCR